MGLPNLRKSTPAPAEDQPESSGGVPLWIQAAGTGVAAFLVTLVVSLVVLTVMGVI